MDKKEFVYRNVIFEYLWFFVLGIPCAVKLDDVSELFMTEKRTFSKGMNLLIVNHGEKIVFMSEGLAGQVDMRDTTFYNIFVHVLNENPGMTQEKDAFGEPITYWYKRILP